MLNSFLMFFSFCCWPLFGQPFFSEQSWPTHPQDTTRSAASSGPGWVFQWKVYIWANRGHSHYNKRWLRYKGRKIQNMELFFVEVRINPLTLWRLEFANWIFLKRVVFWIIEHGSFSALNWQINDEHVLTFFLISLESWNWNNLPNVLFLFWRVWKTWGLTDETEANPSTCVFFEWD